jgi:hypothetical protein
MRNTPAIAELDLYVWEGKADIVDRVARCMASFDVEVIRADNADLVRPSLAIISVTMIETGAAFLRDWQANIGMPVVWSVRRAITMRRSIRPTIRTSCRSTSPVPNCAGWSASSSRNCARTRPKRCSRRTRRALGVDAGAAARSRYLRRLRHQRAAARRNRRRQGAHRPVAARSIRVTGTANSCR